MRTEVDGSGSAEVHGKVVDLHVELYSVVAETVRPRSTRRHLHPEEDSGRHIGSRG